MLTQHRLYNGAAAGNPTLAVMQTPKHGSWLNVAEIELSVLSRQCLDRRVPDSTTWRAEVAALQERRDRTGGKVDWRFMTVDAHMKLKRLSRSFHE